MMKISSSSCILLLLSLLCETLGRPDKIRHGHAVEKCGELGLSVYEAGEDYCCKCPRGKFKKSDCRTGEPKTTQCAHCLFVQNDPNRQTYTDVENISDKCFLSISDCSNVMNTHRVAGSPTENARCECDDGYYAREDSIEYGCHPHSPCKEGFQPFAAGTKRTNTKCERCNHGTFSDVSSLTETCKIFSSCKKSIVKRGSAESDVVCSLPPTELPPTNPVPTNSSKNACSTFKSGYSEESNISVTTVSSPVICHCQQSDEKVLYICIVLLVTILISVLILCHQNRMRSKLNQEKEGYHTVLTIPDVSTEAKKPE